MEEKRVFMWYDNGDNKPFYGPWMYGDSDLIGKKLYHPLDELLKMNISDSIKKKLKSARMGTKIKIHYLHSSGDLMVKRIDEEQIKILDQLNDSTAKYSILNKQMNEIDEKRKKLIEKLKIK
jgi:hypothetical protein